jgi:protein MAK16
MQHDDMIWQIVGYQFCSYKTTMRKALSDNTNFCRHPYSVTGLCNRTSCPLANSKYATLREEHGRVYLCIKTVERAHTPKNLWERILLSRNYSKALQQIDEHLAYFPKILIHRNKQRLTKIHQYLIRMRKIELKHRAGVKAKLVGIHRKIDQREERRERKALVAAKLERSIEKELVQRLAKGTYGDIYNFPQVSYQKALEKAGGEVQYDNDDEESITETEAETTTAEDDVDKNIEYVEELETDEEDDDEVEEEYEDNDEGDIEEMEYLGNGQWGQQGGSDNDSEDDSDDSDDDDDNNSKKNTGTKNDTDTKKPTKSIKPRKSGPRIEIEYEEEREDNLPVMASGQSDW